MESKPPEFFIGIDPGKKGAVGIVDNFGQPVGAMTFPHAKDDHDLIAWPYVFEFFLKHRGKAIVVIEDLVFMRKSSPIATAKLSMNNGILRGLLIAAQMPYSPVHPATWQSTLLKQRAGKAKERARIEFEERWPKFAQRLRTSYDKVSDGIIDAMLIAEFGRLQYYAKA